MPIILSSDICLSAQLPVAVALELLEAVLTQNAELMLRVPPFVALLRVQVCPLVIKLMSDRSLGAGGGGSSGGSAGVGASGVATPFPILLRTLRLMVVLVRQYHTLLAPDCEVRLGSEMREAIIATKNSRILSIIVACSTTHFGSSIRDVFTACQ
jgi:hypothetical protein